MGEQLQFTTKGILSGPNTLTVDDQKAVYSGKCCFGCGTTADVVKINEVRYFDKLGGSKGVRFGYKDQIVIKGLKNEEIETLRAHLEAHGAKLGQGADWYSKGIDASCCFVREQLAVVDEGIMYRWKKGGKNESTFVEWDKINVAVFPGGCTGKKVMLAGELDIFTAKNFPNTLVNSIKEGFKARGIGVPQGKVYRPPIWKCKEMMQNCLVLTDTGVLAKMSKKAVSASELPQNSKKGSGRTIFIPYKNITKIGNAKKLKGYFKIEGAIDDLRSQSGAKVSIVMMKPFCFCSLKSAIKSKMRG
jgi:hypothetical protein